MTPDKSIEERGTKPTDKEAILKMCLNQNGDNDVNRAIYEAMESYSSSQNEELRKEKEILNQTINSQHKLIISAEQRGIDKATLQLQSTIDEKNKEIERLKGLIEQQEEKENDPYWYWGQCDVEGCKGVSCNGGGCWTETGYWKVCPEHSQEFRLGNPQPKMKQSAIDREASRDKNTGCLPTKNN